MAWAEAERSAHFGHVLQASLTKPELLSEVEVLFRDEDLSTVLDVPAAGRAAPPGGDGFLRELAGAPHGGLLSAADFRAVMHKRAVLADILAAQVVRQRGLAQQPFRKQARAAPSPYLKRLIAVL